MDRTPKIDAKKSLGQHFLNNTAIPKAMADAGSVVKRDVVLEIGPGTGVLTAELLLRGATVIGVEADLRAVEALKEHFKDEIARGDLKLFHGDIRNEPLRSFGIQEHQYKVVANIPYYLSGMLFRTFLETDMQPSSLVFLVQREVAERITRDPKESLLSLSVKAYGVPKYIKTGARGNFTPPPKVGSAIIQISGISHAHFAHIDESLFFKILHLGFGSRRKQLLGNLSSEYDREKLKHIFEAIGLREDVRGEDVALPSWISLVEKLSQESN
jgi:16S rRNA (adenine1518-N6/adenine1519-N6)-dimethyltransferase